MKYAIIKAGSSQIRVAEGDTIKILGHSNKPNFEVLFFSDGNKIFTGRDDLKNVKLSTEVIGTGKSRKISVGRFKAKSRYDKTRGFREHFTEVTISKITFGAGNIEVVKEAPAKEVKVTSKAGTKEVPIKKAIEKKVTAKKETKTAPKKTTVKKLKETKKA